MPFIREALFSLIIFLIGDKVKFLKIGILDGTGKLA
jgi:hypothetical protein